MLTIFATAKAFQGHNGVIQTNAIRSWTRLNPRPEIIIFGDDPGSKEICQELGLIHIPDVKKNEKGTPLISSFFEEAQKIAKYDLIAYVNADMILLDDFSRALKAIGPQKKPFLLTSSRWDLDIRSLINFSEPRWMESTKEDLAKNGKYLRWGIDYFVFSRGLYQNIPPFAVGRGFFDGWLMLEAKRVGARIIDVTPVVKVIHQIHDYSHVVEKANLWETKEVSENQKLMKGKKMYFLLDATHRLTSDGVQRVFFRRLRHDANNLTLSFKGHIKDGLKKVVGG